MKRTLLFAAAAVAALPLFGATPVPPELDSFVKRALPNCPDRKVEIAHMSGLAPQNFQHFQVRMTSSDTTCGTQTRAFYSPSTNQVLIAQAFLIPSDQRPLAQRVDQLAEALLKIPLNVVIEPAPLQDGLKKVNLIKLTPYGEFAYHGFVDGSGSYLMVGVRGNTKADLTRSVISSFTGDGAAFRGKKDAKLNIIEMSDFQCPTCRKAHEALEPLIKKNLGKIAYTRIDFPLFENHEWAFPAAMGARAVLKVAPQHYWDYVDYIFQNQEQIKRTNVESFVREFADLKDIPWTLLQPVYTSRADMTKLLDQISRAYDIGAMSTPTFIVNGRIINYGPDGAGIRKVIEDELKKQK